jgi:hypothetical protein
MSLMSFELSGQDLELLLNRLPRVGLCSVRLCSIDLSEGHFAPSVDVLKSVKQSSNDCLINLSSLTGGEFGPHKGFDQSDLMFAEEEVRKAAWARLEERLNPLLLRQVSAYICGNASVNPLLNRGETRHSSMPE